MHIKFKNNKIMKRTLGISFTLIILFTGLFSNATTLYVDSHFPAPNGVYTTIQLAYNAASAGDTILISPASGAYTGVTISKELHMVGTGWADPSSSITHTKISGFSFNAGAEGSSISGIEIIGGITVNSSDITIKRNKLDYLVVEPGCTNFVFIQNYMKVARTSRNTYQEGSLIYIKANCEILLSNNVVVNTYGSSNYEFAVFAEYPTNIVASNNIISATDGAINLAMFDGNYSPHSFYNNIVLSGGVNVSTNYSDNNHNIGIGTQFGTINNNQENVNMLAAFVDYTNSDYHLAESSPAIGAGVDGTDCGIYGGEFPFVDNGRTWLPMITEIDMPTVVNVNDGLNVTVKAKSGK